MKPNRFWTKTEKAIELPHCYFEETNVSKAEALKIFGKLPLETLEELFDLSYDGDADVYDLTKDQILNRVKRDEYLLDEMIDNLMEFILDEALSRDENHIPSRVRIASNREELIEAVAEDVEPRDLKKLNLNLIKKLRLKPSQKRYVEQIDLFDELVRQVPFTNARDVIKGFDFSL